MPQTIAPMDFACPMGTIHVSVYEPEGVVRVFAERTVDPYDLAVLFEVLRRFGAPSPVFRGPWRDADIDVWEVHTGVSYAMFMQQSDTVVSWRKGKHRRSTGPTPS